MNVRELQKLDLPDLPGVYIFRLGRKVLYVGKATSLRDRVRSYFDDDLIATRGPRIVDMVTRATRLTYEVTPTVLEALVREAALIKQYRPPANVEGKDDSTFLYAVVTREDIPRVLMVRGKELADMEGALAKTYRNVYGPFPSGAQLREALRLIRRIFPFYDTQKPVTDKSKHNAAKIEFNRQIEQYPKAYDRKSYANTIRRVELFLAGRGKELRAQLEKDMRRAAKEERFEAAADARRALFALDHVQDVSLVHDEFLTASRGKERTGFRIEGYDTAHLAGTNAVGVMTVLIDGRAEKKEYRTFRIRNSQKNDDTASLSEILSRRLGHPEWPLPDAIVVDGGITQRRAAEAVLRVSGVGIPVVGVVKDERHRPREVVGAIRAGVSEADAVLVNAEAHRFSLARHRALRRKQMQAP
jgi:excinuclease ABC subunit C